MEEGEDWDQHILELQDQSSLQTDPPHQPDHSAQPHQFIGDGAPIVDGFGDGVKMELTLDKNDISGAPDLPAVPECKLCFKRSAA